MTKTIGLDAGHGLHTAGKQTPNGIKEWILNDKVRDKVVEMLSGYDVNIIHTDNDEGTVDEALRTRVNIYKNIKVDAFVSIHHNAYTSKWNNATGVEVFTDKNPTSKDNELANCIYSRLVKFTGLKGRGIKREAFTVINQNTIPAVLVEGGFMDSNIDYKVITSDSGQTAYAKAVAEGLIEFLNLKKKVSLTNKLYRVRKTWNNPSSQIGAYSILDNAKKACKKGYSVFDDNGNIVYSNALKSNEEIAKEVLAGKWGNDPDRKNKLKAAGYDHKAIQAIVNKLYK